MTSFLHISQNNINIIISCTSHCIWCLFILITHSFLCFVTYIHHNFHQNLFWESTFSQNGFRNKRVLSRSVTDTTRNCFFLRSTGQLIWQWTVYSAEIESNWTVFSTDSVIQRAVYSTDSVFQRTLYYWTVN